MVHIILVRDDLFSTPEIAEVRSTIESAEDRVKEFDEDEENFGDYFIESKEVLE